MNISKIFSIVLVFSMSTKIICSAPFLTSGKDALEKDPSMSKSEIKLPAHNVYDSASVNLHEQQDTKQYSITISTPYGDAQITEPLLIDLLICGAIERLKYVRQYGVTFYTNPEINANYNRYEHSVGVLFLLRHYNASLVEQAAGLLHDVSHTVFSHVGDYLKTQKNTKYSYQDEIHAWYLEKSGVGIILNRYGVSIDDVLITTGKNKMLKTEDPDLCADRLEYVLRAGILTNELTNDDAKKMLNNVFYDDGHWYFSSIESAKKIANISLWNTEHIWGGVDDNLVYQWASDALKRAVEIKDITPEEINFSTDAVIWEKLCRSKDEKIGYLMYSMRYHKGSYTLATADNYTRHIRTKFRGINPFVKIGNELKKLTEWDAGYKSEFDRVKKQVEDGWYIRLIS
jgi:uncharacterized protein